MWFTGNDSWQWWMCWFLYDKCHLAIAICSALCLADGPGREVGQREASPPRDRPTEAGQLPGDWPSQIIIGMWNKQCVVGGEPAPGVGLLMRTVWGWGGDGEGREMETWRLEEEERELVCEYGSLTAELFPECSHKHPRRRLNPSM